VEVEKNTIFLNVYEKDTGHIFATQLRIQPGIYIFCWYSFILIDFVKKHINRLRVQVSIPFITKDIASLRLSVTGGAINFPTKKWTKKMETVFIQAFSVNICEKTLLLKIYIKKS